MIEEEKENPRNEHDTSQEALMWALMFNEEDLEANQNGLLSKVQRKRMQLMRVLWKGFTGLSIALLSLVLFTTQTPIRIDNNLWRSIILGVLFAFFAAFSWRKFRLLAVDMEAGVGCVEGDLRKSSLQNPTFKSTDYFLTINGVRFSVHPDIYDTFKDGDPYAIYYIPRSKTIYSAEWLREG